MDTPAEHPEHPALASTPPTARGSVPAVVKPPRWALVIGTCCIVGAVVASVIALSTLATPWWVQFAPGGQMATAASATLEHAAEYSVLGGFKLLAAGLLMTGGIGLVGARRWSRRALLGWAAMELIIAPVNLWLSVAVSRQTNAAMRAAGLPTPEFADRINLVVHGLTAALAIGPALFVLIWLLRARIRAQMSRWP